MNVIPLAMPQIDANAVDKTLVPTGHTPLADLSARSIRPDEPRASVHLLNNQHLYYVFGIQAQQQEIDELNFDSLNWQLFPVDILSKVVILSGTLDQLAAFTAKGMVRTATYQQRSLCSQIYKVFRGANIAKPWDNYDTTTLPDQTIILRSN